MVGDALGGLRREHFLKNRELARERWRREAPEVTYEALPVHRAQLIGDDLTSLVREATRHSKWVWMRCGREGCNDDGA